MRRQVRSVLNAYAVGFGAGLSPVMPGTVGTLVAYPIAFIMTGLDHSYQALLYLVLLVLAYFAAHIRGKQLGDHDHSSIVCDEIVGIFPVLLYFPIGWLWFWAFVVFRIFDIIKPWPISYLDRHVSGAAGCLLDDIVAGLLAFVCLLWV